MEKTFKYLLEICQNYECPTRGTSDWSLQSGFHQPITFGGYILPHAKCTCKNSDVLWDRWLVSDAASAASALDHISCGMIAAIGRDPQSKHWLALWLE